MWRKIVATVAIGNLIATPLLAQVQTYQANNGLRYVSPNTPYTNYRSALGISYSTELLDWKGLKCLRVVSVEGQSNFQGLQQGDCIYAIGDTYISRSQDLSVITSSFPPGTMMTISYFSASRSWAAMGYRAALLAPAPSYSTRPSTLADATSNLNQQIENVLRADSVGWANKYIPGTVNGAQIVYSNGNTYIARANYSYGSGARDIVQIQVDGGRLSCVKYDTEMGGCRSLYRPGGSTAYSGVIAAGVVAAVVAVAVASRGSGSSGGSGGSRSSGGSGSPPSSTVIWRPAPPTPESRPSEPPPRSYGLHGDCPQSGAGYGC